MNDQRVNLLFWAAGFTVCGIILLLFNFDLLVQYEPLPQYIVAGIVGAVGIGFFTAYFSQRQNWWRLIPGWTLLALAAMLVVSVFPNIDRQLIGAILFLGLAFAFAHIYLVNRAEHWWAIIPGGFMLVIGIVIALSGYVERLETLGTVLFVGMGGVFFVLYALGGRRRQWWALVPGTVLVLFGVFVYTVDSAVQNALLLWWPLALIIFGIFLLWRGLTGPRQSELMEINTGRNVTRRSSQNIQQGQPTQPQDSSRGVLGDYSEPAPGATVEVLPERDEQS